MIYPTGYIVNNIKIATHPNNSNMIGISRDKFKFLTVENNETTTDHSSKTLISEKMLCPR
ncbi:hypothetical protein AB7942_10725 [Neobacillus sp. BF23-41]|uniref:hypothetical protein n=1 Tax=Neobacillus sp. BF23-41 TaxID=3240280 RepID=UPI0034E3D62C